MGDTRARAQAHAKHGYFCVCGKVVHGNGARAMHFFIDGDRYAGHREGHKEIGHQAYLQMHGHPLDHPANGGLARYWRVRGFRGFWFIEPLTDRASTVMQEVRTPGTFKRKRDAEAWLRGSLADHISSLREV